MKIIDFLKIYVPYFRQFQKLKINIADIEYLPMMEEYNKLLLEGRKEANVRALMCRRYNISYSKFKGVVRRLNREYSVFDLK